MEGLKSKALLGILWSGAGTLGNGLVSFLVTIILARMLSPSDFALIALLTVFVSVCNVLVDSGFSQAIIRDEHLQNQDLSSVFIFNIVLSIGLYGMLFFASPYIASFYQAPELTLLSRVVFLVIIFNALTLIPNATLKRNLNFAMVEKSSVLGSVGAGIFSVVMAFTGFGIWALVANMVLMPFFRSVFLWYFSKWKPVGHFCLKSIKKYWGFSLFLMLQGVIDMIVTNLTTLFIGKVYTKHDLGYYSQAGKLDTYIVTPLGSVLDKVVYPIFAKLKNEQTKLKEGYREMMGVLLFVTLPTMLFVTFNAENTIVFFFGEKWRSSGIFLEMLSVLGLFQLVHRVFTNVVIVKGNTKIMLLFAIIKQTLRVVALLLTLHVSVKAMVLGFVVSGIVGSLLYIGLGMYYLQYGIWEIVTDNYKTLFATLAALCLVWGLGRVIEGINVTELIMIQGVMMLVFYLLFNALIRNTYLREIRCLMSSLKYKLNK